MTDADAGAAAGAAKAPARSSYRINEIFMSIQGEGVRAGTANVFVRFSGCNLRCRLEPGDLSPGGFDCDTEFESGRDMTAEEIVAEVLRLYPDQGEAAAPTWRAAVVLTGGEPGLQVDEGLLLALRGAHVYVAVETNGSRAWPWFPELVNWLCVSPKVAEHALRVDRASEVKYVRHAGQGIPRPRIKAEHYLLSPAATPDGIDQKALAWCIRLVRENPMWRLSVQQHKAWAVR